MVMLLNKTKTVQFVFRVHMAYTEDSHVETLGHLCRVVLKLVGARDTAKILHYDVSIPND